MSAVVNAVVSILYTSSKDFGEDSDFYKDLRALSEKHGVAILFGKQENLKGKIPAKGIIDTVTFGEASCDMKRPEGTRI